VFVAYCSTCDRRILLGIDEVEWVHNLSPGVISVTSRCPHGHPVVMLTGESFTPRQDPRMPARVPSLWVRAYAHPHGWWARLLRRLIRHCEIQRELHTVFYRF
jgi:hypothetical protein